MTSSERKPINLAVHESTDPEMLKLDHEPEPSETPNDFNRTEDKSGASPSDFDLAREDRAAERQISIANRSAG